MLTRRTGGRLIRNLLDDVNLLVDGLLVAELLGREAALSAGVAGERVGSEGIRAEAVGAETAGSDGGGILDDLVETNKLMRREDAEGSLIFVGRRTHIKDAGDVFRRPVVGVVNAYLSPIASAQARVRAAHGIIIIFNDEVNVDSRHGVASE